MGLSALINPFKRFIVTLRALAEEFGDHAKVRRKPRNVMREREETRYIETKIGKIEKEKDWAGHRRGTTGRRRSGPGPKDRELLSAVPLFLHPIPVAWKSAGGRRYENFTHLCGPMDRSSDLNLRKNYKSKHLHTTTLLKYDCPHYPGTDPII